MVAPAHARETRLEAGDPDSALGETFGPYRVVEVIGRGGMGTVYRAVREDDVYEKGVALKLVKRGMDTDFVLRRFRAERRILAQLDHPHIARLLDGGSTPDGRPYFVMEFVDGVPLDRYADEHALDVRTRLELFLAVCEAVQHAHQRLIVHRDLKPGNVLVTAEGRPKLLDFGIAKLLDPEATTDGTVSVAQMMTPEYASPEQQAGGRITTATDVYALGVVLYELMTGRRPSDTPATDPGSPSVAGRDDPPARILARELDNVVRMAMRPEPSRRYASVEQLAEDVRRYLDGRPVRAQKDTLTYRTGKFLRRHRLSIAATAAVGVTLLAGIVTTAWQARVARAERARAERRFADVRRLANSMLFELDEAIRDLPGATRARQLLIAQALEYVDSLAREAEDDAGLQRELALAYRKVGDVQGRAGAAHLGDSTGALASYRKAAALYAPLAAAAPRDVALLTEQVICHACIARLEENAGQLDAAIASITLAVDIASTAAAIAPRDIRLQSHLINGDTTLGSIQLQKRDLTSAIATLRRAVARGESIRAAHPEDIGLRRASSQAYINLARALRDSDDFDAALALYDKARQINEGLTAAEPQSVRHRRNLAAVLMETGNVLTHMGRWPEAVAHGERALAITTEQAAADPDNADGRRMLLTEDILLCRARAHTTGRVSDHCGSAVARAEREVAANPGEVRGQLGLVRAHGVMGSALRDTGKTAAALAAFRRQLSSAESVGRERPADPRPRELAAEALIEIGHLSDRQGDAARALEAYRSAAALRRPFVEDGNPRATAELFRIYCSIGALQLRRAARATPSERDTLRTDARNAYRQALDLLERPDAARVFHDGASAERQTAERGLATSERPISHLP
jgi:eukaryotic-like serine/threonine-protein kinase